MGVAHLTRQIVKQLNQLQQQIAGKAAPVLLKKRFKSVIAFLELEPARASAEEQPAEDKSQVPQQQRQIPAAVNNLLQRLQPLLQVAGCQRLDQCANGFNAGNPGQRADMLRGDHLFPVSAALLQEPQGVSQRAFREAGDEAQRLLFGLPTFFRHRLPEPFADLLHREQVKIKALAAGNNCRGKT